MVSFNILVLPKVGGSEGHALWISSSESLGNIGVVELLSVTESEVSAPEADQGTEGESEATLVNINVEVVWSSSLAIQEVGECNLSSDEGTCARLESTEDFPVVTEIEEVKVEELWVVLDKLNASDLGGELRISLLRVVWVSNCVPLSARHFL